MKDRHSKRSSCSKNRCHSEVLKHNIQLQLSDSAGFPVDGTQFFVTLTIIKKGSEVTIQFPTINFQTGPTSSSDPLPPLVPGGYIYTADGFLPEKVRPNDLVYRSFLVPSNNGMSLPFSFTQPPPPLPTPPSGYILQITNAGAVVIQAAGTFGNIIPVGPQILLPTDITYIIKPKIKLCKNIIIQPAFTNTTQFTGPQLNNGLRDTHISDAFDNVLAWVWSDNSNIPDKTNGILNVFLAIGKVKKDGTIKVRQPFQLTNFGPNSESNNNAIAINRTDPNNIVVSYDFIDFVAQNISIYRAVSFDGGKTWPANLNGPIINAPGFNAAADTPGVQSDKFGNIWYCYGQPYITDNPTFLASSDKGISFQSVFTLPLPPDFQPADYGFDYPQCTFGGDGQGNYGLRFVVDYINDIGDLYLITGFIPIIGLGQFGTATFTSLTGLLNTINLDCIANSMDGRVWFEGSGTVVAGFNNSSSSYILPSTLLYKSPGPIDQNYAGAWNYIISNNVGAQYGLTNQESQPSFIGYIGNSLRSLVFDEKRQALYAMFCAQNPDYSQNMRIYFIISRNNGQTWSQPIDIESEAKNNRGFQSMALDSVTGNLVFGWYDARNSPDGLSVQYFGAIITAKELDCLVDQIPLSNPTYTIPSVTSNPGSNAVKTSKSSKPSKTKQLRRRLRK